MEEIKVFISHSSIDETQLEWAKNAIKNLKNTNGIPLYFEHSTMCGSVADKISNLINEASVCLVLYTDKAAKSQFVNQEIGYIYGLKKPMIVATQKDIELKGFIRDYDYCRINDTDRLIKAIETTIKNTAIKTVEKGNDYFENFEALNG